MYKFNSNDQNKQGLHRVRRRAGALLFLFVLTAVLTLTAVPSYAENGDYDTKEYTVTMNVQEDNSAYVTETIETDINDPIHGIYRYLPLSNTLRFYDSKGNETNKVRKNMKVEDVSVERDPFVTETKNGNLVIRIGDEDKTITGKHTYNLSYRVRLYDDGIKDYDVFYYNVLPYDWDEPIKRAHITVTMPKAFDKKDVHVIVGKDNETYGSSYYEYEVEGNTITIDTKKSLPKGSFVTLGVMLEEGYWQGELSDKKTYLFLYAMGLFGAAAMVFLFLKRGRDPKTVKTVEFYPPEDMTSAEVGYIIDGKVDRRDVVSLIIYFANKGYLSIEETTKDHFTLHKLTELPTYAKSFERIFFDALFKNGDSVSLDGLGEDFYDAYVLTGERVEGEFRTKEKRLFSPKASSGRILVILIAMIGYLLAGFLFSRLYGRTFIMIIAVIGAIIAACAYFFGMQSEDKRYTMKRGGKLGVTLLSLALLVAACAITYLYMWLSVGAKVAGIIYIIFLCAGYFSFRYMQCRTKYGTELLGKLLGFKEFISVAELEKLEIMIDEDPQYFYKVLPYAYAMGLSKKWAKKFETISQEPPTWYSGYGTGQAFNSVLFYHNFDSCMKTAAASINPPAAGEGGFGSVVSGGFSGGGGFGGGGGGSW